MLKAAKLAEVPRDVIDRNLKKASDKQQADFSEARSCPVLCLAGEPALEVQRVSAFCRDPALVDC